jgi:hypothetical protein
MVVTLPYMLMYRTLVLLTWVLNGFNFDAIKIINILNFIG